MATLIWVLALLFCLGFGFAVGLHQGKQTLPAYESLDAEPPAYFVNFKDLAVAIACANVHGSDCKVFKRIYRNNAAGVWKTTAAVVWNKWGRLDGSGLISQTELGAEHEQA